MPTYSATDASNPGAERGYFGNRLAGFSSSIRTLGPQFQAGETTPGSFDQIWMYVKSNTAIAGAATDAVPVAVGVTVTLVPAAGSGASATPASATAIAAAGSGYFAHAPFAIGQWGWVRKTFL